MNMLFLTIFNVCQKIHKNSNHSNTTTIHTDITVLLDSNSFLISVNTDPSMFPPRHLFSSQTSRSFILIPIPSSKSPGSAYTSVVPAVTNSSFWKSLPCVNCKQQLETWTSQRNKTCCLSISIAYQVINFSISISQLVSDDKYIGLS